MATFSVDISNITHNSADFSGEFISDQADFDGIRGLRITVTRTAQGTATTKDFNGTNFQKDGKSATKFENITFSLMADNEYECEVVLYYIAPNTTTKELTGYKEEFTFSTLAAPSEGKTPGAAGSIKVAGTTDTSITLSYDAVTDATGYNIYYQVANGTIITHPVSGANTTTITISGLQKNTTYFFSYLGTNGNKTGALSETIAGTTGAEIPSTTTKGYSIYIGNGSGWDKYTAYIGTGNGWAKCYVDIGQGSSWSVN